ncbi:unnamed protein product [Mytilus edulis]|uniref:Uncharacterized protein n=1 Tax=Mytilus edulis TaxID=6550 RepID=A0A8S3Q5J8_MYTED|nr:unnamed protein product [Mytilus edulis]
MKRQIERMERELKEKENVIQFMNNEQKIKDTDFSKSMHVAKEKIEKLEQSVNTLKAKNKDQEEENDYVRNLILDNNLLELYDETSNQFTADTIECVMNLQNNNISASKIGEVIRTVCSLCKRQPNRVPSATTVNRISDMKLYIATKQVEDLSKKSNLTLYSDETSKFGKSFEVFAVTDEDKHSYLLGLREMSCKSSETVLETKIYYRISMNYVTELVVFQVLTGCTNRLLSSVYQDICNPLLVAGSRALGIISKIITGPLWRNIECKTHILDINDTLTGLRSFLAEAKDDCSEVVTGKHVPFPEESCKIENDIVMAELFKPDETDVMTIQLLQALFSCMLNLLDRQAADHLPGGKYFSKPTDISTESKSVLKHNKLPEFFLKIQKTIPEQLCKLVDESKSVATVESTSSSQVSLLVGKTIRHKFAEGTFIGNVISVVPGFGKWYNVTYDGDPAVYVYQLQEDYADGNIEIVVRWYTAHAVTVVTFQFN